MIEIHLPTLDATKKVAERLIEHLEKGVLVALDGELGAGKTTFVKYCAKALGLTETVDSPTYTLLKTYGPPLMHHMDAYRLDVSSFDLDDALNDSQAYLFLEWANRIQPSHPAKTIHLTWSTQGASRTLKIEGNGVIDEDLFNY